MQPVAKVALVHGGVQLVGLAQAELALGKEAVGAVAQVRVRGGRELLHGQGLAHGLGAQRGRCHHITCSAVIGAG